MPWCRMPPHGVAAFKRDSSQRERRSTNRGVGWGVVGREEVEEVELPTSCCRSRWWMRENFPCFVVVGKHCNLQRHFFFFGGCNAWMNILFFEARLFWKNWMLSSGCVAMMYFFWLQKFKGSETHEYLSPQHALAQWKRSWQLLENCDNLICTNAVLSVLENSTRRKNHSLEKRMGFFHGIMG